VCYVRPHDPEVLAAKGVLVVVADGMGGHVGGEVASRMAVEAVHRAYYEDHGEPLAALEQAILGANGEIYRASQCDSRLTGMGTTCTALAVRSDGAACAHVGDTRVYLVRLGRIYAMTQDHSSVQRMVDLGLLTSDEARHHADKNVLLRAVGTHPDVEISTWSQMFPIEAGDRFVVCSDGLYVLVEDAEIQAQVMAADRPATACTGLVQLALERGGQDNITVAVLEVAPPTAGPGGSVRQTRDMRTAP
jgi:protein phosphatase